MSLLETLPRDVLVLAIMPYLHVPELAVLTQVSKFFHSTLKNDLTIWMLAVNDKNVKAATFADFKVLYLSWMREAQIKRHEKRLKLWGSSPIYALAEVAPHLTPLKHVTIMRPIRLYDIEFVSKRHRGATVLAMALPALSVLFSPLSSLPRTLFLSLAASSTIFYLGYDSYFDEKGREKRDPEDAQAALFGVLRNACIWVLAAGSFRISAEMVIDRFQFRGF